MSLPRAIMSSIEYHCCSPWNQNPSISLSVSVPQTGWLTVSVPSALFVNVYSEAAPSYSAWLYSLAVPIRVSLPSPPYKEWIAPVSTSRSFESVPRKTPKSSRTKSFESGDIGLGDGTGTGTLCVAPGVKAIASAIEYHCESATDQMPSISNKVSVPKVG